MSSFALPEAAELRSLIVAVERHHIKSGDLPSYLAGLSASVEMQALAAQLQHEGLPPKELASRLRKVLDSHASP